MTQKMAKVRFLGRGIYWTENPEEAQGRTAGNEKGGTIS
jgi:hypothetical protein